MLIGVHADNRPLWPEAAYTKLALGRFELVKMMTHNDLSVFRRVKGLLPQAEVITRLFWPGRPPEPEAFVEAMSPQMGAIQELGYPKFELLNEPNAPWEGWGPGGAADFDHWAMATIHLLRQRFPGIYLVWPGLALPLEGLAINPGYNDVQWWRTCAPSINACDALGAHAYWQPEWAMLDRQWGLRFVVAQELYPHKPLWLTEAGCTDPTVTKAQRAQLYPRYLARVAALGVEGVALWILDGTPEWEQEQNAHFDEAVARALGAMPRLPRDTPPQPDPPGDPGTVTIGNLEGVRDLRHALPTRGEYPWRRLQDIRYLVVHHSGVPVESSALAIAGYHVERRRWPGIGYHFLVHQDGTTEYVGDILTVRYHVARRNPKAVGVCLTGNFQDNPPPPEQLSAARLLLINLQYALGWFVPIVGHRELGPAGGRTACPGATFLAGPRWKEHLLP